MQVQMWQYQDVQVDGTFAARDGAVVPYPQFRTSRENEYETASSQKDGDWLSVSTGRMPDGTMTGITLYFDSREEMEDFISDSGVG